jgi:hypothetical protein
MTPQSRFHLNGMKLHTASDFERKKVQERVFSLTKSRAEIIS